MWAFVESRWGILSLSWKLQAPVVQSYGGIKADGKAQKSVPKAVKDEYAEALKELKQAAKDLKKMVPASAIALKLSTSSKRSGISPPGKSVTLTIH